MALINKKELFSLPVETVSGVPLGRLVDVDLDTETHSVRGYIVRRHVLPNPLAGSENVLNIHPNQVRGITSKKMVVDDAAIPAEGVRATAPPASA